MSDTDDSKPSLASVRLGHVAVNTPDLDRFRRFYEDFLGLRLIVMNRPVQPPFRRMGTFVDQSRDSTVVRVFEVPGYHSGLSADISGGRGRLDHLLAFRAADDTVFEEIVHRLFDAGASSGEESSFGPCRSVQFVDPDGGHHNLEVVKRPWPPDGSIEVINDNRFDSALGPPR